MKIQFNNLTNFILSNNTNIRVLFIVLFLIFGLIIAVISYFISFHYGYKTIQTELIKSSKISFKNKQLYLSNKVKSFEDIIYSVKNSRGFKNYLNNSKNINNVKDIFKTTMKINKEIMQLRYLDKDGYELLRINRNKIKKQLFFTTSKNLQNKANRYYFRELEKLKKEEIWISPIDLNMENGQIINPPIPTLRIALPIFSKNKFNGIIILNIFMKDILKKLVESALFKVSLVDKEGYFIYHFDSYKSRLADCCWSKYLQKEYNLIDKFPSIFSEILNKKNFHHKNVFTKNIHDKFNNPDELILIFEAKQEKIEQMQKQQTQYIVTISLAIFFLSIPVSFLLSNTHIQLSKKLIKIKDKLFKEHEIVNRYVPIAITDVKGVFIDVSNAFCDLTGYNRDELLGKSYYFISSKDTSKSIIKELLISIENTGKWKGELKNIHKNGDDFWVILNINCIQDKKGKVVSYHGYYENITNSKKLYNISITDGLTSLYNRRYFDELFPNQIKIVNRDKTILAFVMIDIDHFKQYNDTYGHQEGDNTLKEVAKVIKNSLHRANDYTFRLGGEEFGMFYTISHKDDGLAIANEVRKNIENLKIEHINNSASSFITISMGLYIIRENDINEFQDIYKNTDKALYEAKRNGRNQVKIYES